MSISKLIAPIESMVRDYLRPKKEDCKLLYECVVEQLNPKKRSLSKFRTLNGGLRFGEMERDQISNFFSY